MDITKNAVIKRIMVACQVCDENQQSVYLVAAATKIAYSLELPVSPTERLPRDYFTSIHEADALDAVSKLNETKALNVKHCLNLIQSIWVTRYYAAHQPESMDSLKLLASTHLNPLDPEVLNTIQCLSDDNHKAVAKLQAKL